MIKNLILGLVVVAAAVACSKEKSKEVAADSTPKAVNVNDMPALTMTKTDGKQVSFKQLDGKVMIVFFNPGCDHCQREAEVITANKETFSNHDLYFVSPEPMDSIAAFSVKYDLTEPNMHFGRSEIGDIVGAVGMINSVPTIFVYDKQTLVARMEGEISIEKFRQTLK